MVATAAWCSRILVATASYDLALNVGVCGSFDRSLAPGAVVHVMSDRMPELGAEDDDRFLTIQDLRLLGNEEFPFQGGALVNSKPPAIAALRALPTVAGITVNTVHGREHSIAAIAERVNPQVESMEGAGFMFACLIHDVPFAQVRGVSNVVERRNRAAWRIREAVDNVCRAAFEILESA
jgi:futalosine hydrolase